VTDVVARILAARLSDNLGQPVVVENRAGGASMIGMGAVAKSAPDGYMLGVANLTFSINPILFKKMPYDSDLDLALVSHIASAPFVLSVHPSLPVRSVKELIALAKQRPGTLNYGSGGNGSPGNLIGEMFRIESGINVVHVPYKALTQALTELVSGQLQLMFVVSSSAVPQLTAGRIRGLAVTSLRRSAVTPNIPTLEELGMRGFEATGWYGILAPAGTPAAITAKLNEEIVKALRMPDVAQRMTSLGLDQVGSSQKEFGDFVKRELAKWASVVKTAGIRAE